MSKMFFSLYHFKPPPPSPPLPPPPRTQHFTMEYESATTNVYYYKHFTFNFCGTKSQGLDAAYIRKSLLLST